MGSAASRHDLELLLAPVVTAAGLDLEGLEIAAAGRRRVVRVYVDKDGGVDLDAVAEISREISAALDGSDLLGGSPYVLEVSSPGIDRPLTEPRHWRRAADRLVTAALIGGGQLTGRVYSADDAAVQLEVAGRLRKLDFAEITSGRVQVEFNRPDSGETDGEDADAAARRDEEG